MRRPESRIYDVSLRATHNALGRVVIALMGCGGQLLGGEYHGQIRRGPRPVTLRVKLAPRHVEGFELIVKAKLTEHPETTQPPRRRPKQL